MLTSFHLAYALAGVLLLLSGDRLLGAVTLGGLLLCTLVDQWMLRPPTHVRLFLSTSLGAYARLALERTLEDIASRHALSSEQLGYLLEQMGRELRGRPQK